MASWTLGYRQYLRYLLLSFRYDWNTIKMAIKCVRNMEKFYSLRFNNPHVYLEKGKKITHSIKVSFKPFFEQKVP